MQFENILADLFDQNAIEPIFCIGIHCSQDRKNEYGTAKILDYKGRGAKASLYTRFVMEELLPYIRKEYNVPSFKDKSFAGFSLGALSAMDIVWNNPADFIRVGAFSGSFWWRDKDQEDEDFDEEKNRIMHRQIGEGSHYAWLKFFFEVGTQDETADRNNNGIPPLRCCYDPGFELLPRPPRPVGRESDRPPGTELSYRCEQGSSATAGARAIERPVAQ